MTTKIMRRIEFDAAHRVLGHEGKCRHIHGHRYAAEVHVQAPDLDDLGRVVDFGVIKERVGDWINAYWDHNIILCEKDPQLLHFISTEERKPFMMKGNPTAENLAKVLHEKVSEILPKPLRVCKIVIWETPTCYATYEEAP